MADVVVVLLVVAAALWDPPPGRADWIQGLALAGLVLPILWRRTHPGWTAAATLLIAWTALLGQVWREHLPLAHVTLEILLYTLVARGDRRKAAFAAAATLSFFTVWAWTWYPGTDAGWGVTGFWLSVATTWVLGEYVRARRAYLAEVEHRAHLADSERHALARAAVADERARIARELHDALAHNIGVIVVNAEGAQLMRHHDPSVVGPTLDLVSAAGRAALVELRRLLAVLQVGESMTAVAPTEDDLRRMITNTGAGSTPVTLRILGTSDEVPADAMMQVYRIVQEALTNVVKHAGCGARAEVTVDFAVPSGRRTIRVDVRDFGGDPESPTVPPLPSSGRGLVGIRERAALFGGAVRAGATPSGYQLTVTLPLDQQLPEAAFTAQPQDDPGTMRPCPTDHRPGCSSVTTRS
jgi:signal transduction histidine kinase